MAETREGKNKISKALKNSILNELETMPNDMRMVIGDKGSFSREELKEHIEKEDDIGMILSRIQLNFMKALASGEFSSQKHKNDPETRI